MLRALRDRRPLREQLAVELSEEEVGEITERRVDRVRAAVEKLLAVAPGDPRLPILPETASEVLAIANDPATPMNRLERIVARDAVLASRMLTVASSAAYGGASVRTLHAALQRLGSGTIRDILYQSVMECHVFRGDDQAWARQERDHAVAVGTVARIVCRLVGVDAGPAFVCGLLHDLGRVALRSLRGVEIDASLRVEAEHVAHAQLGSRIATAWKLPPLVVEALRRHHGYRGFGAKHDGYSQIGHIVAAADVVCNHLGQGRPARALDDAALATVCSLGLDPKQLVALARDDFAVAA
jgi:putative nucleotidyltransferase with HDIG domain